MAYDMLTVRRRRLNVVNLQGQGLITNAAQGQGPSSRSNHHRQDEQHRLLSLQLVRQLVSWSLTSLYSTNMAISETNGHSL